MTWIINNIGTIITLIILLAIVALIIRHIKKDKAQGKSSCGCKCGGCPMSGSCHKH